MEKLEKEQTYLEFYKDLELRDYMQILINRKKVILTFIVAFAFVMGIKTFTTTPIYKATAQVLVESISPTILTFEEIQSVPTWASDYYESQVRIIKSYSLAERIVDRLNLRVSPRFGKEDPASVLLGMIEVESVRKSRLINVHVSSDDPQLAATIANTLVEEYISKDVEDRLSTSEFAVKWLDGEIDKLKSKVEVSERKLQDYREKQDLVSLEENQNIVVQKLAELSTVATAAKARRLTAEAAYRQIEEIKMKGGDAETLPTVIENKLIEGLKSTYAEREAKLSELLNRYKEKHPKIIELRSELEALQDRIDTEVAKVVDSIKTEYEEAKVNETSVLVALAEQEKEALSLNRMAIEYNVFKREADANRSMYNSLLERMKEADISGGLKTSNIRIIDKARVPKAPVSPNKTHDLLIALITGTIIGMVTAFTLEYLDDSIKNQRDIETYVQLPFLGYIPIIKAKSLEVGVYAHTYPRSEASEALRSIRTNINFTFTSPSPHALLIASAIPQEGKTSVTVNVGIIMAQGGNRVLVADCDMRHPTVHKVLQVNNSKGMRDYLAGTADFDSVVQKTSIENLSVVTAGPVAHNPTELLGSPKMPQFIKEVKAKYDKILIDAPPIIAVSDALILAKILDGAICVVRGNKTSKDIVLELRRRLENIDTKIIGVILNNINLSKQKYYYTYYHGEKIKKKKSEEIAEAASLIGEEVRKVRLEASSRIARLREELISKTSGLKEELKAKSRKIKPTTEPFEKEANAKAREEAMRAKLEAKLKAEHEAKAAKEAKLKAKEEARQAKFREIEGAKQAKEREEHEAVQAKEQEKQAALRVKEEAKQAKLRAQEEARQAKEREEQQAIEAKQREKEEKLKAIQEAKEAKEREKQKAITAREREKQQKERAVQEAKEGKEQGRQQAIKAKEQEKQAVLKAKEEAKQAKLREIEESRQAKEREEQQAIEAKQREKEEKLKAIQEAKEAKEREKQKAITAREREKQQKERAVQEAKEGKEQERQQAIKAKEQEKQAVLKAKEEAKQAKLREIEESRQAKEREQKEAIEAKQRAKEEKLKAIQETKEAKEREKQEAIAAREHEKQEAIRAKEEAKAAKERERQEAIAAREHEKQGAIKSKEEAKQAKFREIEEARSAKEREKQEAIEAKRRAKEEKLRAKEEARKAKEDEKRLKEEA